MEKAKVALLAVIALALSIQVFEDAVPEAHAQSTDIVCNAWYNEMFGAYKGEAKMLEKSMAYAGEVRTWLLAHPGDVVFRSTLVQAGTGFIDIACVRTP